MIRRPPRLTRTDTPFPYPTLYRAKVAEAAKVIENTQRDVNIALIYELAMIFNAMGIDTHDVLAAAGTKWNFLPFTPGLVGGHCIGVDRSEEHTSELKSLMRISYAVFCLKKNSIQSSDINTKN